VDRVLEEPRRPGDATTGSGKDVDLPLPGFRGASALSIACQNGHVETATLLLDRGANFNRTTLNGDSSIMIGCWNGRFDVVRLCLDRGADLDRTAQDGSAALHYACWKGCAEVVTLCLDRGAQVDRANVHGLHFACKQGCVDAARLLLARGADINRVAVNMTPHDLARDRGHSVMALWLRRIQLHGWTRHLAEPRYKLVVLRALAAGGRARQRRAIDVNVALVDFLFPGDLSSPRASKQAKRSRPHLPDELFSIIARYYWGGGLSAEEEAAVAAEAAAAPAPATG